MRFSLIITAYNVEDYIEECLRSVLKQTYSDSYEVIIVDDASTDDTGRILDRFCSDPRLRVFHLPENRGNSYGRNLGLTKARGDWIAFIDGDDYIKVNYLETISKTIDSFPSIDMVFIPLLELGLNGSLKPTANLKARYSNNPYEVFDFSLLSTQTQILRKDIWSHVRFPEGKYHEDVFTIYQTIGYCNSAFFLSEPLYVYRRRPGSITQTHSKQRLLDQLEACVLQYKAITTKISEKARESLLSTIYFSSKWITLSFDRNETTEWAFQVYEKMLKKDYESL